MSNRIGLSEVILSASFFLVAIFTLCVVLLAFIFNDFSGLFLLVSDTGGVYGKFYLFVGLSGILSIASIALKERSYQRMRGHFFIFSYTMLCVFVVNTLIGLSAFVSSSKETQAIDFFFFSMLNGNLVDGMFFLFFVALPFIYYSSTEEVLLYKRFYTFPHIFVPSPNIMMVVLFSFAIQPLNKDYWWEWWEIGLVLIGVCMIAYLCYRQKFLFASYERFNFILLIFGVVVFIVSHSVFEGYASQYAAKKTIYLLALLGWVLGVLDRYKIELTKRSPLS